MKRFLAAIIFSIIASVLFAQPWITNLPQGKSKDQLKFTDYTNAFGQYWAPYHVDRGFYNVNGVQTKATGWKQFKRWEHYMAGQVNPSSGEFPKQTAQEVTRNFHKSRPVLKSVAVVDPSNWTSLGPTSSDGGYAGVGRLNCIAFHPTDNNTYWVGAAGGGIWVTTDNGSSWNCLSDKNGVLAVSDIIIPGDYTTSHTIYIATGDRDHWDNNSIGVLKSTDSGATWTTTGLTFPIANGSMVFKLLIDPGNNQTLLAATSSGIYKTTDGGTTWNTQLSAISFVDLEYKPGDFNTLYASTTGGSIYMSSNGGSAWTQSFTNASARRIDLTVSANQPTNVFALAANTNSGLYGIYKSTNSGVSFTQVFSGTPKNMLGWASLGNDTGGQGWYDLTIAASPSNANTLLVGGVNSWRSLDGGTTWAIVDHWWGDGVPAVHADKHMLRYRDDGNLFECNDGGVYSSTDNGTTWTDKTHGIVISQMYKLGVSQTVSDETVTGLQDNGTKLLSAGNWGDVKGGDGMECLIDYSNVNIQYGTYVNGQLSRTTDHWASSTDISANIPGGPAGSWVTPFLIDPTNPQILYVGYSDIWKTTDRGDTWTKISSMNTASKVQSMAIAQSNAQVLYVADPSVIWKTTNNGTSWSNITGTLPVNLGSITYIAIKNNDANTLWVTLSGYSGSKVYQSTDGGSTWSDIAAGLPQIPVYTIVQNKQTASEVQLYVGTEVGIYFKKGADSWVPYNNGLPNVSVGEIEFYYAANPQDTKLRAATFGRGLWESPVYYSATPMSFVSSTTTQNNISNIAQNQVNQTIIGVQVVTDGNLSPINATSFAFNTAGSTNTVVDITNAKLFYSGANSSFATTTQFGSTVTAPSGGFVITGTQTLNAGTNYFWLTYDVPAGAVIGDLLDAQCDSLTVGTNAIPTVTNPSGSRSIGAVSFCTAGSSATTYEYISKVAFGSINQTSTRGANGYQDYTSQSTTMQIGLNYAATITVATPYTTDQILIWIDWNKNGNFTDPGENVYVSSGIFASPHTTANFTPPVGTPTGSTRMRIRLQDAGMTGSNTTSCGSSSWGEVEDYSINVIEPCTPPAAPTGPSPQPFCGSTLPTVANLSANEATIKWYANASGGVALATSTALVDGVHYFATQTVNACESTNRLDILASVSTTAAPTGSTAQSFCASNFPTVANLSATGTAVEWYSVAIGGTPLASSVALVNGTHYYASQALNSCPSTTRLNVTATVTAAPSVPTIGTITQPTCALATGSVVLSTLPGTGTWTLTRTPGTTSIGSGTSSTLSGIPTGTYTYTVTNAAGCISVSSANVVINAQPSPPLAPSGTASQSFCAGALPTVASLAATGTALKWYAAFTGGTVLSTSTALVDGTHYFASQTVTSCESSLRFDVLVTLTAAPAAPTGSATQTICSGAAATVANLTATGTAIIWYAAASGGTALATTVVLVNGTHYYGSQTVNGCESTLRLNVTAAVTAAPTGSTAQSFCAGNLPTVANLTATGTALKWYAAATGGTALATTVALINGTHYYASQNVSGCESASRLNVTATVTALPKAPTGTAAQSFCAGISPKVSNLVATGTAIKWYAAATGGTALATTTALVSGTHYYASQTINTCESSARLNVTATITAAPSAPTGTAAQSFCSGSTATVAALAATGTTIKWYAAATGGTALATTVTLVNGTHYYASQTIGGCESAARFNVTATVVASPTAPAAIGGTKTVCTGKTTTLTDATAGGVWSSLTPAIATISSTGVVTGVTAGSVTIQYKVTNAGGCSSTATTSVTVTAAAAQPGNFTASTSAVSLGQSNVLYTVPLVSGVTYTWSYSGTGATITGTTNSVRVAYSLTATSGTLGVTATNSCGTSIARTLAITGLKAAIIPAQNTQSTVEGPAAQIGAITLKNDLQVYPNPTQGQATFELQTDQKANVKLDIYSVNGQLIERIFEGDTEAGIIQTVLFSRTLSAGIYPCVMSWNGKSITVKLVVIK